MSVRTQLERGKSRNCTQAGHFWYSRAGMAVLRINEGPTWAPSTFRDALGTEPGPIFELIGLCSDREEACEETQTARERGD